MESRSANLAVNHKVLAPQSMSSKQNYSSLTKNGIWNLRSKELKVNHKEQGLVVQFTTFKILENDAKTKAKAMISDGVTQMNAVFTGTVYDKLSQEPKQFDVVEIGSYRLADLKGTLIMIPSEVKFINTQLTSTLGSPQSLAKVQANPNDFNFE